MRRGTTISWLSPTSPRLRELLCLIFRRLALINYTVESRSLLTWAYCFIRFAFLSSFAKVIWRYIISSLLSLLSIFYTQKQHQMIQCNRRLDALDSHNVTIIFISHGQLRTKKEKSAKKNTTLIARAIQHWWNSNDNRRIDRMSFT